MKKIRYIVYYLFNKKEKFNGCSCDCDCMCEFAFELKEYRKIQSWFRKFNIKKIQKVKK